MKWLLVLFATYMLVLPCIPCNAAEVCCTEGDACAAEEAERPCTAGEPGCREAEKFCPADEHPCREEEHSCPADEHPCREEEHSCSIDEHPCPEKEPDQQSCPDESGDQHEHSATCPCCPSFSCNTCHSIIVSSLVLVDLIIPAHSFDNISFADKPLANFPAIIWQPPRASLFYE